MSTNLWESKNQRPGINHQGEMGIEELTLFVRFLLAENKVLSARLEQLENKVNAQSGQIYTLHGENHSLKMSLSAWAGSYQDLLRFMANSREDDCEG
jgi:predicted nuclease with TOPRIM domain